MIEKARALVGKWREEAKAGRDSLLMTPVENYSSAFATILRAERDADELDSLLSALNAEGPSQQEDEAHFGTHIKEAIAAFRAPRSAPATAEEPKG